MGWVLTLAGAGFGALGDIEKGQATSKADRYQAQIANNNAFLAKQNAGWATQFGEIGATQSSMKTGAEIGAMKANAGAAGIDVNTGSTALARSAADELGNVNALTIKSNAAREAYGYTTQSTNYSTQAALDKQAARDAVAAGNMAAFGTLLSGASSSFGQYNTSEAAYGNPWGISSNVATGANDLPTVGLGRLY